MLPEGIIEGVVELRNEIFGRIFEPALGIGAMAGAVAFLTWLFSGEFARY